MTKPKNPIDETWQIGSDNVFADLDMPDAAEKLVKTELVFKINQIIKKKKLKQSEAAKMFGRGRLSSFSIEDLLNILICLIRRKDCN